MTPGAKVEPATMNLKSKGNSMTYSFHENEELMMFVIVPILMIPVGWIVTKILNYYDEDKFC